MPGVPPDAVEQVKKGFRGFFSRRKKQKAEQNQASGTSTSSSVPTETTTAPPPAAGSTPTAPGGVKNGSGEAAAPQPGAAPRVLEPAQVAEAKAVDLDPSHVTADTKEPAPPTASTAPATETASATPQAALETDQHGMSATSGPLDDHLDFGEGDGGAAGAAENQQTKEEQGSKSEAGEKAENVDGKLST